MVSVIRGDDNFDTAYPAGLTNNDILVVAGGGSGAKSGSSSVGGGGGAGGLIYNKNITIAAGTTYSIVIGAGGAGQTVVVHPTLAVQAL